MKIVITGGAGFIGSHLVEHFHNQGDTEIVVLDNLSTGNPDNISNFNYRLVEGSIEDRELVAQCCRNADYVFHMAAMVSVVESMDNPLKCTDINIKGTLNVLQEAADSGVKKMIFSSSCSVYGDPSTTPTAEDAPTDPMSPYALSKLDGEFYLKMFSECRKLPYAVMRYFNVYGPRQNPASQYAAAIPIFVSRALKGEDINIYGDGTQSRDFVYVKDVVRANVHMMTNGPGPFNVGTGRAITIQKLAETIVEATGSSSRIINVAPRPGEVLHSCAVIDKITATGFQPQTTLEDGLQSTIDFFRQQTA